MVEYGDTINCHQAYPGPLTRGRETPRYKAGKAVVGAAGSVASGSMGGRGAEGADE